MSLILDGFWLPGKIRQEIVTPETPWVSVQYLGGEPVTAETSDSVTARWPVLNQQEWTHLISLLTKSRKQATPDFIGRLQKALEIISLRFNNLQDPLTITAMNAIPAYTGYAPEMIRFTLHSLDQMPLESLEKITQLRLPGTVRSHYVNLRDLSQLEGRIRFYGSKVAEIIRNHLPGDHRFPVHPHFPGMVLGFASGNVIGTSHLISLLAQVSALIGSEDFPENRFFPTILVKNSRQEPIFTPLLLTAIEEIDPALVASIGLMVWDYEDTHLQEFLVSQADLVIAAAADLTITAIDQVIRKVQKPSKPIRFHRHGHKVSFSTISTDYLACSPTGTIPGTTDLIHLVTLLAAVDSIYWDQQGCLSSRIHFVERGDSNHHSPLVYGKLLAEKTRILSTFLPRGNIPLHNLHNRFDKYASLTVTGKVQLCSEYNDGFLIVVDERPWSPTMLTNVINDCVERTIFIRPVDDINQVPVFLKWLPAGNLQTMSVAIDGPDITRWSTRFAHFVDSIGKLGITAVRTVGRGPFPQFAYSWDGYLPLDLSLVRSPGYFTTVEFENTYQQILETYQLYSSRSNLL